MAKVDDIAQRIEDFYKRLDAMNHYEKLFIDRNADAKQIKDAYRKAVRELHPDLHAQNLNEDQKRKLETIFNEVNSAYRILSDKDQKIAYDGELYRNGEQSVLQRSKGVSSGEAEAARNQYRKGVECLKRNDVPKAITFLKSAVELRPDKAEYFAKLAVAQMSHPRFRKEARTTIRSAIKLNGENATYYAILGRIYQKDNELDEAERYFKMALSWDPRHRMARMEMKNIREAREEAKTGLFHMLRRALEKKGFTQKKRR